MTTPPGSGIDSEAIKQQFEQDSFAKYVGVKILEVARGFARVEVTINAQMLNAAGVTHGSAIFTAADFALAVASNSYGEMALATNISIHFMKATKAGTVLQASATEENRTRKTGLYRIEVTDSDGQKIAIAHGSVHLMGRALTQTAE